MLPYWIVLGILLLLCVPVVFFYSRRGVTPWHRPKFGEVVLFAIIMIMISAAVAAVLVKGFGLDRLRKETKATPEDTEEYIPLAPPAE